MTPDPEDEKPAGDVLTELCVQLSVALHGGYGDFVRMTIWEIQNLAEIAGEVLSKNGNGKK